MNKPECKLSDTRALDLIWAYVELFPDWTEAQRLDNVRKLLVLVGRGSNYLAPADKGREAA